MSSLDELLERTTIEFSFPINSEEIESRFFGYLERALNIHTKWSFSGFGYGASTGAKRSRYIDKLNLTVSQREAPFIFASFEFQRSDKEDYFDAVRLATYACDDLEELRAMPSGEGQLDLTDKLREATQKYFSQRPKL